MVDISRLRIPAEAPVRDALARLNETGVGVLLIVDDQGRFVRTVTDGDLRRLMLADGKLSDPLGRLGAQTSITLPSGASESAAMALMNEHKIDHIPLLAVDGRLTGLYARRELDARIYLSRPHLSGEELHYVEEAFRSNWVAPLGPNVDAFERELAAYVGIGFAAALSSGTAALHLALRLLGVQRGDSVFCSSLTFVASANPILYLDAVPTFIDSDATTWTMAPAALEKALQAARRTRRLPKAVIVVSLYGQSADMDRLAAICDRYEVPIIEDAAESLGATYRGRHSGTLGRIGVYSFNGNKIITTSGGGMLVSDTQTLVDQARFLATQARDAAVHYEHSQVGYNYRMSNVLAGIGRGQLHVLDDRIRRRRQVFEWYQEFLDGVPGIEWMPEAEYGRATRWLTAACLHPGRRKAGPADVIRALAANNIEARPVWKPMHLQPLFRGSDFHTEDPDRPVADHLFRHGLCLPSGSDLEKPQVERICQLMRTVLK